MKSKIMILIILIFTSQLFSWGQLGHEVITRYAIEGLPKEMTFFKENVTYLCDHSTDPDKRKDEDPEESHKHYIDIDHYKEFNEGKMIIDKDALIAIYGEDVVNEMGILPWNTVEVLNHLTNAIRDDNEQDMLFYAADLAHYVADAHQPQHNILNYNGKLTNQKGIHQRYEIHMINKNLSELEERIRPLHVRKIKEPLQFIFDYCTQSNSFASLIEKADIDALKLSDGEYNNKYYDILWFRTKYMTYFQFTSAAEDLASLYYTAWLNAGKPNK